MHLACRWVWVDAEDQLGKEVCVRWQGKQRLGSGDPPAAGRQGRCTLHPTSALIHVSSCDDQMNDRHQCRICESELVGGGMPCLLRVRVLCAGQASTAPEVTEIMKRWSIRAKQFKPVFLYLALCVRLMCLCRLREPKFGFGLLCAGIIHVSYQFGM